MDVEDRVCDMMLRSDRGRIKQTLINLIANAYKFTNKGSITVAVRVVERENEPFAEFSVRDTGVGISKEDQGKLFTLFGMLKNTEKINPNG